jgi:ATP-dependent protease Clp ATPase subunit
VPRLKASEKSFWSWMGLKRTACIGCGASSKNRKDIVVGPSVALCRECWDEAFLAMKGQKANIVAVRGSNTSVERCSFCGRRSSELGGLASWPKGAICADCMLLCDEILTDRGASDSDVAT